MEQAKERGCRDRSYGDYKLYVNGFESEDAARCHVSRQYYGGCMIERNHRLVESADLLLAVFNGVRRSGAVAAVNYARKLGREITVIAPITRQVTC